MTNLAIDLLSATGLVDSDFDPNKPIWEPIPGSPQERAYNSDADVIGFGGAAGGGKSWLGLGFAVTKHKRTRIFRRTYRSLRGLIDDGDKILAGRASFVEGKGWRFNGKTIMAGYVEHEKDWEKWKGDRVDLMVFDEADQFTFSLFDKLKGWNGTTDPTQKVRLILGFNPPNATGEWLIDYFGAWLNPDHNDPADDGELRYFIKDVDGIEIEVHPDNVESMSGYQIKKFYAERDKSKFYVDTRQYNVTRYDNDLVEVESRTFFRALVDDNPYAMQSGYGRTLEMMSEPLRSQLRYGLFNVGTNDNDWQVIPTDWILRAQDRWQLMKPPDVAIRATGVDVARGGKDNFVIANLRGSYFDRLIVYAGATIPKIKGGQYGAKLVLSAIGNDYPVIGVDADGLGASVYDHLLEYDDYTVYAINSGTSGYGTDKSGKFTFNNLRSMMWWALREALDPESGIYIALPPDRTLRAELRAPTYRTDTGKIVIERKDKIRDRIGRSTDYADAIVYAWHVATHSKPRAKPRSF